MAPLCADNNNLLAYHMPIASSETSQFVAIAQHLMQQQQQHQHQHQQIQQKPLHNYANSTNSNPIPFHNQFQAQHQQYFLNQQQPSISTDPAIDSLTAPWQAMKPDDFVNNFCLIDLPAPDDLLMPSPAQDSGLILTSPDSMSINPPAVHDDDDDVHGLMQGLINPSSRSGSGMSSLSCVELLDAFMTEGEFEAMASFFEEPSESTQSTSEAAGGAVVSYADIGVGATFDGSLPDGFTVLQEARRYSMEEEKRAWDSMAESSRLPELVPYNDAARITELKRVEEPAAASVMLRQQQQHQQQLQQQQVSPNGVELMQLLLECAKAIETDPARSMALLHKLRTQSSTCGDPIQRLTTYFSEALAKRLERVRGILIPTAGEAMRGGGGGAHELTQAYKAMSEACPYFTFAQLTANEAILEAIEGAERVRIVDFGMSEGVQWAALLQAIAGRRAKTDEDGQEGHCLQPPRRIRITGVDLGTSTKYDKLEATGRRLEEFGRALNLNVEVDSVQLHEVHATTESGELVVANFMLELSHALSAEGGKAAVAKVLAAAASLSPKITTLAEMEAPLDDGPFQRRFVNALHFFSAMFDSLEAGMARECAHRLCMERRFLGDLIVSVVGGPDHGPGRRRLLSHSEWHALMTASGFRPSPPFSGYAFSQARFILWKYCDSFSLSQPYPSTISLGWHHKTLLSVSSWSI